MTFSQLFPKAGNRSERAEQQVGLQGPTSTVTHVGGRRERERKREREVESWRGKERERKNEIERCLLVDKVVIVITLHVVLYSGLQVTYPPESQLEVCLQALIGRLQTLDVHFLKGSQSMRYCSMSVSHTHTHTFTPPPRWL